MSALRSWAVELALLSVSCASTRPGTPAETCTRVAAFDEQRLEADYAQYGRPLIILGPDVFTCGCELQTRQLAGATENRSLEGAREGRSLAGAVEQRQLAGANEARSVKGDTEGRQLSGSSNSRALEGATEERQLGGAVEQRSSGGTVEARAMTGSTEQRNNAGDGEARQMGGQGQERQLGGEVQGLRCVRAPGCDGFRVSGRGVLRYYAGERLVQADDRCVL